MKTTKISTILVLLLGLMICQAKVKGAIDGSGTANHIPKFTDPNTLGDSAIYEANGNIGIGTTEPGTKLHVESDSAKSVLGKNTASGGIGVEGQARNLSGGGVGVYGKSYSTNGAGVFGIAAMSTGKNYGIYGQSQSPDGWAGYFDGRGYFSGFFGIGRNNPTRDLHIYRDVGPAQVGIVTADTSSKAQIIFGDGGGNTWTISSDNTDNNKLHFRSGHASGTPRVTFQQNGNVGIGTTVPSSPLNIKAANGNSTGGLRLTSSINGNNVIYLQDASPGDQGQIAVRAGGSDKIVLRANGDSYFKGGNVGIGTTSPAGKLTVCGGNILIERSNGIDILELGEGLDYAEGFNISDKSEIAGGTVLVIDSENPGKLAISDEAYDSKVAGIVAGAKGLGSGVRLGAGQFDYDVALAGRVYCNVDATEIAVQPGDLLTTSATEGYAMKATDYIRAQGAILGKAMEKLEKGKKGQIMVLVTLQ